MRVTLHGFRCYQDCSFTFDDKSVNLIHGQSGTGKSTIFQAITWCLYGTLRNTSTRGSPKSKMWVSLDYNDCTIYRQRNPGLLVFTDRQGIQYKGPTSQQQIEEEFGNHNMWYATSYIEQGGANYLITAPSAGRMQILSEIVFMLDNPKFYQEKIKAEIRNVESSLSIQQSHLNHAINEFKRYLSSHKVNSKNAKPKSELEAISTQIKELNTQLYQYIERHRQISVLATKRQGIETTIVNLESQLSTIPVVDDLQIEKDKVSLERYNQWKHLESNYLTANNRLPKVSTQPKKYTMDDYRQVYHDYNLWQRNVTLAKKLGVNYDQEIITALITKYQETIEHQSLFSNLDYYQQTEQEYLKLKANLGTEVTDEEMTAMTQELRDIENSRHVVLCPNCQTGLRYLQSSSELIKADVDYVFDQARHRKLTASLAEGKRYKEKYQRCQQVKQVLDKLVKPELPKDAKRAPLGQLYSMINDLKHITVVKQPAVSPDEVMSAIEWWKLHALMKTEEAKFLDFGDKPEIIDQAKLNRQISNQATRRLLVGQLHSSKIELDKLPPVEETSETMTGMIASCKETIANLDQVLSLSVAANVATEQHTNMKKLSEQVKALHSRLTHLQELRTLAVEVECRCLEHIVEAINYFLETEAASIFDESISMRLSLYKTLKTTGLEKTMVNLQVGESTDIRSYSGGERERFNILLTLALHRVCGNGILIFDESLSCLDTEIKDQCLSLIKRTTSGSTVMIVDHGACLGNFEVTNLNTLE